jgi:hypothetical protein
VYFYINTSLLLLLLVVLVSSSSSSSLSTSEFRLQMFGLKEATLRVTSIEREKIKEKERGI